MKQLRQNAPNGWLQKKLGHLVADTQLGGDYPSALADKGTPLVKMINIGRGVIINCDKIERIEDSVEVVPRDYLQHGDLLLNTRNSLELVGKVALWRSEVQGATFNNNLMRIEFKPGAGLLNEYANLWFNSYDGIRQLRRIAIGTTSVAAIYWRDLASLKVCVPPRHEQRKIADILTTWDEALTQLDALIDAKDRRKKALMQQLLTGRKRFPAFAKSSWKKVRMNEALVRVFRPIEWTADMPLSLVSLRRRCGGLFRRPDVLGADYKTQDLHELKADDFLISKRQVVHGAWGLVAPEFTGCHVSKEYAILVNKAPGKLDMAYFAWLAQTPRMIRLARVASTGVHIEKLIFDPDVFLRESVRIPSSILEQRHIAAILDAAQAELTLLRAQRSTFDQQKRGLMQRLLTGKIRVKP